MTDYTTLAMRTMKPMGSDALDFAHAALGMVDESYELILSTSEENTLEELGDLLWFVALAGQATMCHPFPAEQGLHDDDRGDGTILTMVEWLHEHASLLAGRAKKWMVSGKRPGDDVEFRLARMVSLVRSIGEQYGWTLEHIQDANIRKLAARYPEGYSDMRANHRDLYAEERAIRGRS